ncbi:MAG: hypothetical protein CM15mP53_00290 [Ectothiorhodospiraceae bacterium]|nr:MAG: hypothetical protein CM15mP53_00290 [Ectothiorhodospiraceae bacterium]
MKDNKINLNGYKVNYPNSEKIYKRIDKLRIPYRAITISDGDGGENSSMYMILLVLIQTQVIT